MDSLCILSFASYLLLLLFPLLSLTRALDAFPLAHCPFLNCVRATCFADTGIQHARFFPEGVRRRGAGDHSVIIIYSFGGGRREGWKNTQLGSSVWDPFPRRQSLTPRASPSLLPLLPPSSRSSLFPFCPSFPPPALALSHLFVLPSPRPQASVVLKPRVRSHTGWPPTFRTHPRAIPPPGPPSRPAGISLCRQKHGGPATLFLSQGTRVSTI